MASRFNVTISYSISWTDVAREAVEHLGHILAHGTSTPPAWEFPATKYLLNLLEAEGIPAILLPPNIGELQDASPASRRPNLVAHLTGSDIDEPLLLLSHLDSAPRSLYDLDFSGHSSGTALRGPGALMGTHLAVAQAMAMILLVRSGVSLRRTVRFAATSDGAGGNGSGLKILAENHLEHITSDIALGWGSLSWINPDQTHCSLLTYGEKGSLTIKLRSEGGGGRTGVRLGRDPVERLVAALDRLDEIVLPPRVSDESQIFIRSLATTISDINLREILEGLNNPVTVERSLKAVELEPAFDPGVKALINASLRTERNLVRLNASASDGLKPSVTEAEIHFSFPPGEDVEAVALQVMEILKSNGVYLAEKKIIDPCKSELRPEITALTRAALNEVEPDAKLVVGLSPWPTGLGALRRYGTGVFSWEPFATAGTLADTLSRRGGPGEMIEIDQFIREIKAFYTFLIRVAH